MFSLQKLLGKEDLFFSLLEQAAAELRFCAAGLEKLLSGSEEQQAIEAIRNSRSKNKLVCEEISTQVAATFITALEREDIEALATSLYRAPKPIEKFAQRYLIARQHIPNVDFKTQAEIIARSATIVCEMLVDLRNSGNQITMRALNTRLQQAEAEADLLENKLLEMLYADRSSALRVLIVKDLYEILEQAVDRCRDTGSLITHILLKNS